MATRAIVFWVECEQWYQWAIFQDKIKAPQLAAQQDSGAGKGGEMFQHFTRCFNEQTHFYTLTLTLQRSVPRNIPWPALVKHSDASPWCVYTDTKRVDVGKKLIKIRQIMIDLVMIVFGSYIQHPASVHYINSSDLAIHEASITTLSTKIVFLARGC